MSEVKEAQKTEGVLTKTHIGGQALIEGVMMRGRFNWAVAVRQPGGGIYTESHDLASGRNKNKWMYWPIIRGCTALVESLGIGYKALEIAGNHAYDFEDEGLSEQEVDRDRALASLDSGSGEGLQDQRSDVETQMEDPDRATTVAGRDLTVRDGADEGDEKGDVSETGLTKGLMTFSMVLGLVLGVVLFIALPAFATNLIMGDYGEHTLAWNLVDGVLRVAIFILYIWLISLMKDIRRMFGYHGAEHKTIHCYEHGLELTPENALSFPRLHVRCGTAFMIMTMIIAILVFTVVPVGSAIDAMGVTNGAARLSLVILSRIILLPLVAGLSYELTVKWAGSRPDNPLVKVVLWPGMQMQRLTTNPPDESMIECAIAAMNIVIERERAEAEAGNEVATMPLSPCEVVAAKAG